MPLYTLVEIEAALARSNGQSLDNIRNTALVNQSLEERGRNRDFGSNGNIPYANKSGHNYSHVATFSMGSVNDVVKSMAITAANEKSRWQDRRTCVAAVMEIMNSAKGQRMLTKPARRQVNPTNPANPLRIDRVPLIGDFYGFESTASTVPRKISHGTALILVINNVLFVTTSYPEVFVAGNQAIADVNYENVADLFI